MSLPVVVHCMPQEVVRLVSERVADLKFHSFSFEQNIIPNLIHLLGNEVTVDISS